MSHPALRALAEERTRFLCSGDPAAVFPVFYYHVTEEILRQFRAGSLQEGPVVLELLEEFYAAWEQNRSGPGRAPHWQPYFQRAERLRRGRMRWRDAAHPLDRLSPRSLPALSAAAHIDGDLPGCIARVLARHAEIRGARLEAFEASFRSLDPVFYECTRRGFQDLATRIPGAPGPRGLAFQSRAACRIIISKRRRAWQTALRLLSKNRQACA